MAKQNTLYTAHHHSEYLNYLDMLKKDFISRYKDPPVCKKRPSDFDKIKPISSGAYGEVFLIRNKGTFQYHAMKVVEKSVVVERKHVKHLIYEKKILQSIQFPFLVSLDFSFKDNVYLYFVLPFIPGGELFYVIQKYGCLSDKVAKFYVMQVILAVEYLHHCDIIHRDIKPENILVEANGYIKLVDYGFCKIVHKKTWTLCGTPEYLAPEVIVSRGYSFPVDWWAIGILTYEMITGHPPFCTTNHSKLYEMILNGSYKTPDQIDSECKVFIRGLLQVDSAKRLGSLKSGVFDIKSSMWFSDVTWDAILHQRVKPPIMPVGTSPGDTTNFPDVPDAKLREASRCLYENEFAEF